MVEEPRAAPVPQHRRMRAAAEGRGRPERVMSGVPVSPGIAIGPVHGMVEAPAKVRPRVILADEVAAETRRLDAAVAQSRRQLAKLRARLALLPADTQEEMGPLLDAYIHMIGPTRLLRGMRARIAERLVCAEVATEEETAAAAHAILARDKPGLAEDERASLVRRADEVREIGRRLVRNLTAAPFKSFARLPEGAILVCDTLRPADAALIDPSRLAGVAAAEGGADGHTAVMLRALGIPAVLAVPGVDEVVRPGGVRPGDLAVLDGGQGTIVLNPTPERLVSARRALTAYARERASFEKLRRLPAETTDGVAVELQANLELPAELPLVAKSGAQGIGLLRTEFLFMNRETVPDEDAQTEAYRAIIEAMGGDTVTIRVLDWGGEKTIDALDAAGLLPEATEPNPALGLRGIRLLLRRPELLETQLAAILRASAAGPVRIMLPMVTTVGEVRAAREAYERVLRRLRRTRADRPPDRPPLGVMIETPAAALSADALALECDFLAIGTNDLTAYALAVDRAEADVADLYDPLHPAVLRLMQFATEAALRLRKPVSICGEVAGNPTLTPLLLGLGLRSYSMNASAVPRVKQAVRGLSAGLCARFARRVMEQTDAEAARDMIARFATGLQW